MPNVCRSSGPRSISGCMPRRRVASVRPDAALGPPRMPTMRAMRRAVLAMVLCAAPLLAAPAHASPDLLERQALRAAAAGGARARHSPLPDEGATAAVGGRRAERSPPRGRPGARAGGRARATRDLPGVAQRDSRRLGASPRPSSRSACSPRPCRGRGARARARRRPARGLRRARQPAARRGRPARRRRPGTGIKYTWFYDDVRAADALLAAGGGSRRSIAVIDTGLDVAHPELAGRIARTFDTVHGRHRRVRRSGHGTFVTGLIAAIDGNGIGGKGVAGNTQVLRDPRLARTATSRAATCCAASTSRSAAAPTSST